MLFWTTIVALLALSSLGWMLRSHMSASRIEAITNRRRPTSRIVSSGEYVDGNRHLNVALALTKTDFHYENRDMQASFDLRQVREIEYDTRLATGHTVDNGNVLRIRCASQQFEFVLPKNVVERWHLMLPPRRPIEPLAGTTYSAPAVVAQ